MHMHIVRVLRAVGRFLDLHQQPLMCAAMFSRPGIPLLLQQPLFAGEVQAREFNQPVKALTHFLPAASMHQGEAQFIQRVQQHAVLIVHGLDAGRARMIPG